jgi:hypothetical protein
MADDDCADGNPGAAAAAAVDKPREALSDWIRCVCVVTFDLEFGQAMEVSVVVVLRWLHIIVP